jgi:gas vesicle protein
MNQKFVSGLIIGAVAGAALALFLSSDKGKEILENIKDAAGDAAGTAKKKLAGLDDELHGLLAKGKAFVENVEQKIKDVTT